MAITPADIQAQTFSEAKRGYDPAEVDVFLETLSSEVDAMLAKIVDLKGRLTATEQQLADAQAQLAQAQDTADQAVPAAPVAAGRLYPASVPPLWRNTHAAACGGSRCGGAGGGLCRSGLWNGGRPAVGACLLYTSDAADE